MKNSKGFTIVELLVAIAITGIVMAGVYSVYYAQQKSALVQEQMAAMQQNLRAALYFLEREIRIAGYNPERTAAAGIAAMNNTNIRITMDLHDGADNDGDGDTDEPDEEGNGDGDILDPGEDVTYLLLDPDGDGIFGLFKRDNVAGIDIPARGKCLGHSAPCDFTIAIETQDQGIGTALGRQETGIFQAQRRHRRTQGAQRLGQ